ncbi:WcbI family polysaccharide biosynthesis putative acetyltransferase [Frigoribacterium sp. PhB116]|uniref:WcbI family polysaccharide biosynthesis putative acetyltransferase n=1 Tax=Frigoribacterium sp. PhB116 TaxID=2485174 RepID=UPI001062205D|nr:WcbI family polysaccharide biosynthesis putative acetyltransferase [Frigoribacterium sp. PhB116]TDT65642.1 hypothetical protein EDF20_0430 [Frigoribacterium sp. PhB116]
MTQHTPAVDGRTRHYGHFYGLGEPEGDGPVAVVIGNCQAESLRVALDGGGLRTVRTPAVHELVTADLPHLDRWLARASVLVSQPVRDDYHDLPLGTRQLTGRLGPGARVVAVPVVRFAGLYPTSAIVRPPHDPSLVPPLVDYHDLVVLAEAAARRDGTTTPVPRLDAESVRSVAALSLHELRKREEAHDAVVASDLFDDPSFAQMRTLNHPGNPVWTALASRVRDRLGLSEHVVDPGRQLLDSVHAPRLQAVVDAFGLDDEATDHWIVEGTRVPREEVREAHLRWYEREPQVVDAGLARHADSLALLGLA